MTDGGNEWLHLETGRYMSDAEVCSELDQRAAPRSGVACWVAREDPRLGADAKPDPYKRVILSRDLGDLLNLAPGECARVRITREEA